MAILSEDIAAKFNGTTLATVRLGLFLATDKFPINHTWHSIPNDPIGSD